jgi:hypothetical protein
MPKAPGGSGGTFNSAQYEEIVSSIQRGVTHARAQTETLRSEADSGWVPEWAEDFVESIGRAVHDILKFAAACIEGSSAPLRLAVMSYQWSDQIQGYATSAEANTKFGVLDAPDRWSGDAAAVYRKRVAMQPQAAGRLGDIASAVSLHLAGAAGAGFVFYVGLAGILANLLTALKLAIGAVRTGLGAIAGIGVAFASIMKAKKELWALTTVFGVFVSDQILEFMTLVNETTDWGEFPNHKWPSGVVEA